MWLSSVALAGFCRVRNPRQKARECLKEYEDAISNGHHRKLHRVAHHFLARGTILRAMFESYATTDQTLDSFGLLFVELKGYAGIPIVCRRAEAVHARVKILKQRCKPAPVPTIQHILDGRTT